MNNPISVALRRPGDPAPVSLAYPSSRPGSNASLMSDRLGYVVFSISAAATVQSIFSEDFYTRGYSCNWQFFCVRACERAIARVVAARC